MRSLTKKSLDELAKVMPVIGETEQRSFIGGNAESGNTMPPTGAIPPSGSWDDPIPPTGAYNSYYIGSTSDRVLKTMPTPTHAADYIAQQHDLEYQKLGLSGISGTLSPKSRDADDRLIKRCDELITYYEMGIRTYCGYSITSIAYHAAIDMKIYFEAEQKITGMYQ